MPGHYSTIVNLDEVVLSDYQQTVFRQAQRLLTERADSGTGETILPDAYVIQKELLTMITDSNAVADGNPADDASRLVNMVLDIEEVEIAPTLPESPVNPVVLGRDSVVTDSIAVLPTSPANNISTSLTDSAVNTNTTLADMAG